jgi:hypothetical protein
MSFLSLGWIGSSKDAHGAIRSEVDHLVRQFGVHAYEEASRRRLESRDVSTARYWGAVKSEIGRDIMARCGEAGILAKLERRLFALDLSHRSTADRSAEDHVARAERRESQGVCQTDGTAIQRSEAVRSARYGRHP